MIGWLPNISQTLKYLKRLEEGNDDLINSCRLFWLFNYGILSPEEFRLNLFKEHESLPSYKATGGHVSPELESLILEGIKDPDKVAQQLLHRLDSIAAKIQARVSATKDDYPTQLFISTQIESARLARLVKAEGYSDNTKATLKNALGMFFRCDEAIANDLWPKHFIAALKIVGAFLVVTQFSIQKADAKYEESLKTFLRGIDLVVQARLLNFKEAYGIPKSKLETDGKFPEKELSLFELKTTVKKAADPPEFSFGNQSSSFWVSILSPQTAADCFETLKQGDRVLNPKVLASVCLRIAELHRNNLLGTWDQSIRIKDFKNYSWDPAVYWHNALEWTESHLNPSEILELLQENEDKTAQKRLKTYFFSDEIWDLLPERAKCSLINADRDRFSGKSARSEAVLNEIKIATEELLLNGLWKPLSKWILAKSGRRMKGKDFVDLVDYLNKKGLTPSLANFEDMLGFPITEDYLSSQKIDQTERGWILKEILPELIKLRKERAKAEHENSKLARGGMNSFYNTYLGLGRPGILPRLAALLSNNLKQDQTKEGSE